MSEPFPPAVQREQLLRFAEAIDCRARALARDECGDWAIQGKQGHIYACPEGFQLCFVARYGVNEWDGDGPHIEDYRLAKRLLMFANLAQDGTGEGIFFLDRLPNESEAAAIRDVFGILRRVKVSEEHRLAARERMKALRSLGDPALSFENPVLRQDAGRKSEVSATSIPAGA
jgi:hypothetical protein